MRKKWLFLLLAWLLFIGASCSIKTTGQASADQSQQSDSSEHLDIKLDDFIRANQMSELLKLYKTVRIKENISDASSTDDYTMVNGKIANIYTSYYEDQKMSQTLIYDIFYANIMEDRVYATIYIEHLADTSQMIDHESILSQYFEDAEIVMIEKLQDSIKLNVQKNDGFTYLITVDAKTLVIQQIEYDTNQGYGIICTYGQPIENPELLKDLDGPQKEVEILADVYQENSKIHVPQTIKVPSMWEAEPACFDLYGLYTDESCTTPFKYPGDMMDYQVYLSNARG